MSDEEHEADASASGLDDEVGTGTDAETDTDGEAETDANESKSEATETDSDTTVDVEPADGIEVELEEDTESLPPGQIDRVFSLLESAVGQEALEGRQFDRLVGVLESALAGPSDTNPETVAELVSILEDAVVEPDDLDAVEVDGLLSVLEEAVAGTTPGDGSGIEDAFSVLEAGLQDPTSLSPEDVERFRAGVEDAIVDVTDPSGGGIDTLFPLFGLDDPEDVEDAEDVSEMFSIARVAAGMTQRATGYSMESGVRTGTRMAYAVANAESVAELLTETRAITLDELQRAGIDVGDERADWLEAHEDQLIGERPLTEEHLREQGRRLLSRSAEVGREESFHPAFGSVLADLAADEARILRVLATEGTQACMDVRDKGYVPFNSRLVAGDLTMLGSDAGCRCPERTPAYLQNLDRLGLVEFSSEPVEDLKRYQVLEAQPHVEAAREAARRPKTNYGSLRLTDFGVAFCETCLPVDVAVDPPETRFRRESGN